MLRKTTRVVNIGGAPGLGVSIDDGAAVMGSVVKNEGEDAASTAAGFHIRGRDRAQSCCDCITEVT